MHCLVRCLAVAMLAIAGQAFAHLEHAPPPPKTAPVPTGAPKLIIMISIDQFSTDIFGEYRGQFTGGLKRLQQGVVFPNGYQSHAATETCPGHSTILTGSRPARTGIIANEWIDQSVARADKKVYCAEDPTVPGSSSSHYSQTVETLLVPTLGDYMKTANPAAKVVAVAGKDRAAIMMGGHKLDQIWWWGGDAFTSYPGRPLTPTAERVNAGVRRMLNQDRAAMELPAFCTANDRAVQVTPTMSVGDGHFARKAGDKRMFRASPEADSSVLVLAASLMDEQKLGRGDTTDLLIMGLSATDYVGHTYGNRGTEMCLQLLTLDRELGAFFDRMDATGIDYMVALTADHGGPDITERLRTQAVEDAERAEAILNPAEASAAISVRTGIKGDLLLGTGPSGDFYVNRTLTKAQQSRVLAEAIKLYSGHRQVEAVLTRDQIIATPAPSGPPENWSLLTMAKASFHPARSGDLVVLLKSRVMPITTPKIGAVLTHGSPWGYDRRVPIMFWRQGMIRMEQPQGVETVDILPTLAAQISLPLQMDRIDGKCLDLDPSLTSSCPTK